MDCNHSFSWPKFEFQTKTVFNNLISDTDFLDVTLVTEDGKQIKAHKVILSESSDFFRQILVRNPHQHPLLYLKGISSSSLGSLLKFIYLGEVNILLDHLDAFIQASEDLKINGILNINQEEISLDEQVAKRPRLEKPPSEVRNNRADDEEMIGNKDLASIQAMINQEQEDQLDDTLTGSDLNTLVTIDVDDDDDVVEIIGTSLDKENIEQETHFCDRCDFETSDSGAYEEHIKKEHLNDIPCKQCKFKANTLSVLKDHIVGNHKGLPCNNCQKQFSDITVLRKHVLETPDCSANVWK